MKPYSVRRMRKECQVIYRLLLAEAVLFLAFASVFGGLWKVLGSAETKDPLIVSGVFLVLSLFLLGAYFVVSDTKWMIKHTVYGKTLARLGDVETLMREIDEEAESMAYECASFDLLKHWVVLYHCSSPQTWGRAQVQYRPIPVRHLVRIGWSKETSEENGGFWVRIVTADGAEYELFVWESADIEALRQWGAIQEKQER